MGKHDASCKRKGHDDSTRQVVSIKVWKSIHVNRGGQAITTYITSLVILPNTLRPTLDC